MENIDNWKIAGKLYPTSEEELESSSLLPVTYASQVIEKLIEVTGETNRRILKMCLKYSYLIDNGFEDEDEPLDVARNIWDLWLNE